MTTQTVEMFGKPIEYDPSLVYGIFTSGGQYGRLPVEKTLPKWAQAGDKTQFVGFLESQLTGLKQHFGNGEILDALVAENILEITGSSKPDNHKAEIQNTIRLFEYIIQTL